MVTVDEQAILFLWQFDLSIMVNDLFYLRKTSIIWVQKYIVYIYFKMLYFVFHIHL